MFNFSYPLRDALQELIWDFQSIGQEFIRDMEALEPEINQTLDDIEAKYPDFPLEDSTVESVKDEFSQPSD